MDATAVKVCRCVGHEVGSSGCRRQHWVDPDSNKKMLSDSSTFLVSRTCASNLCSLTLSRKGRRGERRRRPKGFPLASSKERQIKSQPAPSSSCQPFLLRAKEDGSSCTSSSGGVASSVDINTATASGPGRTMKCKRRAARRNSRQSLCYSSPFGAREGGRLLHAHRAQSTNSSDSGAVSTAPTGGDSGPQVSSSTFSGHSSHRRPPASATSLPALNNSDGTCEIEDNTRCSKSDSHPHGFTISNGDGHERGLNGQVMPSLGGFPSTGVSDSPRSVSSAGSFETLTSAGDGSLRLDMDCNICSLFAAEAEVDIEKNGEANDGLGIVDRTLLDSWKRLPWQARLCPRAIEEREFFRQTSALEEENLRVRAWRQKQQMLATSAAREEEGTVSSWWKRAAKESWALQSGRRKNYERLETQHAAELAELEKQRVVLLSSGYGVELAALDRMDQSNLRERLRQMEFLVSSIICDGSSKAGQMAAVPKASHKTTTSIGNITPGKAKPPPRAEAMLPLSPAPPAPEATVAAAQINGWQIPGEVREDQQSRIADCIDRISAQTQSELEAGDLHASAMVATVENFRRRRQSFIGLLYRGLTEVYRDVRAGARRSMVSECAADIGRIKQTGLSSSGGDGSSGNQGQRTSSSSPVHPPPPARGNEDSSDERLFCDVSNKSSSIITSSNNSNSSSNSGRSGGGGGGSVVDSAAGMGLEAEPTTGIGPEAAGCRERLRATREIKSEFARVARWDKLQREVLRRSTAEIINLLEIDGLRPAPIGGGVSGGADPIQAARKRARASMRELKRRQADASSEAISIEQSWMAALGRWEAQLGKARAAAVRGEIREFWILQREDFEAVAIQENATTSSLARRRDVLATSWEGVYREERIRTGDTAAALRHCLLGASAKLQELVEESWRGRLGTTKYWKNKMTQALSRSRRLAATMDHAQRLVDDAQAALAEDLAKIVAENAAGEIGAAAVARRSWWAEAGRHLGDLFLLGHGIEGSTAVANGDVNNNPVDRHRTSATEEPASSAPKSVPMIEARLEASLRKEEKRAEMVAADLVAGVSFVSTKRGGGSSDGEGGGGGGEGGGGEGGGPLHLAEANIRRRIREAMEPCAKALEAARDCLLSNAVEQEAQSEPENAVTKTHGTPSLAAGESDRRGRVRVSGGSDSGSRDGRRRHRGSNNAKEEDPDLFGIKLEADAIRLAAASYETEVRGLAIGTVLSSGTGATEPMASTALPAPAVGKARDSPPSTQSDNLPASCLTRSELDLKRAARAGSFARALGEMLFRARAALVKNALKAAAADEQTHDRGVTMVMYRHTRRAQDIRTRARVGGDEALRTALKRAEVFLEERSSDWRRVAEMRRRVVGSVVRWIDGATRSHIQRSERRLRERQARQHRHAASLRDSMRSISDEQRGLLCRVREEARDAIEAARGAIDGHVAEVVHRRQEKEGARASAAADVDLARDRQSFPRDGSSRAGDEPALREGVGDNGQGDEVPDGGEPRFAAFMTEEQAPNSAVEGSCRSKNTNEGDEDGGGDVQDVSGDEDNLRGTDPQENQDQGPHRSRAEEEDDKEDHGGNETTVDVPAQREVLAAIAAAEASCLSRVFPWARDARHRARETAASWNEEVASGCRNERTTTNTELETLALAFRAAKKEADEDVFGSHERDSRPRPPGVAGGHADVRPGEMSGSTNWVPLSGVRAAAAGRQAESVPHCEYRAEEQKESSALWLSFERLLPSLQIDHQRRTGKGGSVEYCYGVEEEEEEGEVNEACQSALRTIDGLESELKREVAAAFAGKIEEARSMMRAVKEKLRSERGVPRQQERGKEKAEAVRLAQQRARAEDLGDNRAEGAVLHAEDVGTERVPGEDATTAGTADRPRP